MICGVVVVVRRHVIITLLGSCSGGIVRRKHVVVTPAVVGGIHVVATTALGGNIVRCHVFAACGGGGVCAGFDLKIVRPVLNHAFMAARRNPHSAQ